jgi:anti-sigma B factor antagonist
MDITIREVQSISILDVQGEITLYEVQPINDAINELVRLGKYKVIFNLAEVTYIDSSGLGAIIRSILAISKHKGVVHFCSCYKVVENLITACIKSSKTQTKIFASEEEAMQAALNHEINTPN